MSIKALLTGSALVAALAGSASAQSNCIAYEPLRRTLEENGVRLQGSGVVPLASEDGQVEIWASPNGEWAILAINSIGIACIVISGEGWQSPEAL